MSSRSKNGFTCLEALLEECNEEQLLAILEGMNYKLSWVPVLSHWAIEGTRAEF